MLESRTKIAKEFSVLFSYFLANAPLDTLNKMYHETYEQLGEKFIQDILYAAEGENTDDKR